MPEVYHVSVSPAENTRARSDAFAVQNSLPKFEYVLHPRTTGFTFIVDRLRKGSGVIHFSQSSNVIVSFRTGAMCVHLTAKTISRTQMLSWWWKYFISRTRGKWHAIMIVDNPLTLSVEEGSYLLFSHTFASSSCQPLQHPWDSHVSLWANSGSPPGFLNTTSGPVVTSPTHPGCWARHKLSKQVLWINVMSPDLANSPLPLSAPLTDMLCMLFFVQVHCAPLSSIFTMVKLSCTGAGAGRCHPVHLIFNSALSVRYKDTADQWWWCEACGSFDGREGIKLEDPG